MSKNKNQATTATAAASKVEAAAASKNENNRADETQVTNQSNVSVSDTKTSDADTRTFIVAEISDELAKSSWSFGIGETYVRNDGVSVFVRDILAPAVTGSTHTRYIVDVNGMPAEYTNTGKSHMVNGVPTCASPDLKALLTGKELTITAQSARIGQKYGAKSPLTAVILENYEERATAAVNAAVDALAQLNKQIEALNKLPGLAITANDLTDDNKSGTLAAVIEAAHTQAQNNADAHAKAIAEKAAEKVEKTSPETQFALFSALAEKLGIDISALQASKTA